MKLIARLMLQVGLGVALAAGATLVPPARPGGPPVQEVRARAACLPLHYGFWRDGRKLPRRRVRFVSLTSPETMAAIQACRSPRRT